MPDPRLLQIDADLECELDGNILRIRSDRDRKIVCDLPNVKTLFALGKLEANRRRYEGSVADSA